MPLTLNIINQSSNASQAIVFQVDPQAGSGQYSVAWLSTPLTVGATARFSWSGNYSFIWGMMQDPKPGAVFRALQTVAADAAEGNAITLSNARQNMQFVDQRAGSRPGIFSIVNAADVPRGMVAEGIAQENHPVFVVAAQPNIEVQLGHETEYWIAFGDFEPGELLDPGLTGNALLAESKVIYGRPVQVKFPPGVMAMTATLYADNSWTVFPAQ